jgi:nitroreductase
MIAHDIGDESKREKTRTKYLRTPAIVVVGCAASDHPTFHDENRDAVAAGIQNLLLGATALGLASFWSTPPVIDGDVALDLCGFAADDRIIGVIYLGWPTGSCDAPQRPAIDVRHVDG